jgi:hypothetical protein
MNQFDELQKRYHIQNVDISDVPHEPRSTLWLFGAYGSITAIALFNDAAWWLYLTITIIYLIARSDVRKYYRKQPRDRPD